MTSRLKHSKLYTLCLLFSPIFTKIFIKELNILSSGVRGEVLNFAYPALLVVFFSILEGNTKESTWLAQHAKTLQITKENHDRLKEKINPLVGVRSISIKVNHNKKVIVLCTSPPPAFPAGP